ncbi:hypothetical protein [Micromonospora thermarum]|uniref:Bacterial Ig-like domain-containing protein n=1 Tax=Micromonospora thermarum TaxID=2720024 RepID=A0ABX0YZQ4_9ACTN|nr:hypothetical protein [Micromonospora thermarum]NJP30609.1 hypothetical protein [Micromonospora thermarum]
MRIAVSAFVFAAGGTLVAAPAAVAAADTAPPVLAGITVSPDAVSVAGLDLVPVTVTAYLTDETGVEKASDMGGGNMPFVALKRVAGGTASTQYAELSLTSGTPQDGRWTATIQVPSTWNGQWEISKLVAVDAAFNRLDIDPPETPDNTLDVTGTHLPAVTMRFVPDPLVGDGPLTVEGRFYYEDTGEGIPNQPIFFGHDNLCVEYSAEPNGTTNADGTFSKVYPKGDGYLQCVGILRPSNVDFTPAFIVVASRHPRVKPVVTATASRTTVVTGTKVTFTGTVKPTSGVNVELQQLHGSTWRKVGSTFLDDRGGFTFDVTPKAVGTHRYRAIVPNDEPELVGVSETVVLRVTAPGAGGQPGAGAGGSDGGLPITGPAVGPMVGGAAALLLAGAGLMLIGRRRRVLARG